MRKLNQPPTDTYRDIKSLILGPDFPFFYIPDAYDGWTPSTEAKNHSTTTFWSHTVLRRPNKDYPLQSSDSSYLPYFVNLFVDIASANEINCVCLLRINVNATYPNPLPTYPHTDHDFPHTNMLLYLTDAGGKTVCTTENSFHDPEEDDIVLFTGEHYNHPPEEKRRVVVVYTFLEVDPDSIIKP